MCDVDISAFVFSAHAEDEKHDFLFSHFLLITHFSKTRIFLNSE